MGVELVVVSIMCVWVTFLFHVAFRPHNVYFFFLKRLTRQIKLVIYLLDIYESDVIDSILNIDLLEYKDAKTLQKSIF